MTLPQWLKDTLSILVIAILAFILFSLSLGSC